MKPTWRLPVAVGAAILFLVGCQPATPGPERGICKPNFHFEPVHAAPPDNSLVEDLQPVLTWTWPEGCKPSNYEVDIRANNSLEVATLTELGGLVGNPTPVWTPPSNLDVGQAYMWRVRAHNGTIIGPYSNYWMFIVGPTCETAALVAPEIVTPAAGSIADSMDPEYRWSYPDPTCTPGGYRFQVSAQPDFSTFVYDETFDSAYKAVRRGKTGITLADCTTYYWRVAASDGINDGPWSSVADFHVNATFECPCLPSQLKKPVPIEPGFYSLVPSLQPTLDWYFNAQCAVDSFSVHLSPINDMSDTSLFADTGSPDTEWAPAEPLPPATQFWWQVAAQVGTDFSPYGSLRTFFTGPECVNYLPVPAPTLVSPANGEVLSETYAVLRYKPGLAPGEMAYADAGLLNGCIPDGYLVDLQTDPSFGGANLLAEYDLPATTVLATSLDDCTKYYWRVTGVQGGELGSPSHSRWFFTNQSGDCPAPSSTASVLSNLHCRLGASTVFPIKRTFLEGDIVEALGRSRDKLFLLLKIPEGGQCWAPTSFLEPAFNVDDLQIVSLPPTPTPAPVCTRDLPRDRCEAAGGTWRQDPSVQTAVTFFCDCGG